MHDAGNSLLTMLPRRRTAAAGRLRGRRGRRRGAAPARRTIAAVPSTYFDDKRIYLGAYDTLNKDKELALKNSVIIVVYNGVILLVGEVRTRRA